MHRILTFAILRHDIDLICLLNKYRGRVSKLRTRKSSSVMKDEEKYITNTIE